MDDEFGKVSTCLFWLQDQYMKWQEHANDWSIEKQRDFLECIILVCLTDFFDE